MARTDRAYRKMMRRKTMLCAEKDYRDILLRDCQEQARKKTDAYRTQLMRELYTAHPDWIPAEEAGKIVFDSRMAQFDADMAFVRKQASTRAAKAISKDPACAEREEEKLQQLQKEHEELRNQYSCRLQREISAQLTDMPGDGAEREAAVSDIERKVDAFRAEQEKAAQKQMETIRQAEDSKIQKLSDALGKLQLAPADRPGLPEGVVLRVQDLCMYFGGVHAVDGLSFDVKKGEIFGLIGPNGAGKTTLFRLIMGLETPDSGEFEVGETVKVAYVDQQHKDIDPNKSVYQVISGGNDLIRMGGRDINARAYLSRFNFSGADQEKLCGVLSGGERNRLHLALCLKEEGNVLLLDEPTNDIDVNTLRALEEGLEDFAGCAVVISHDRWFLDRICTHILAFEGDSNVFFFEGSYSEYEENKLKRLGKEEPTRVRYRKLMND